MGDVVGLDGATRFNVSADEVLKDSIGKLKNVLIIGYDNEGFEHFDGSFHQSGEVLWILERYKKILLDRVDKE